MGEASVQGSEKIGCVSELASVKSDGLYFVEILCEFSVPVLLSSFHEYPIVLALYDRFSRSLSSS